MEDKQYYPRLKYFQMHPDTRKRVLEYIEIGFCLFELLFFIYCLFFYGFVIAILLLIFSIFICFCLIDCLAIPQLLITYSNKEGFRPSFLFFDGNEE